MSEIPLGRGGLGTLAAASLWVALGNVDPCDGDSGLVCSLEERLVGVAVKLERRGRGLVILRLLLDDTIKSSSSES